MIKARVRKCTIEIDLEKRLLKHDCDDWRKGLATRRICKHVIDLFLTIPKRSQ